MSRNKYPGYCYCCGEYVKPGFGHYEKTRGKNMYRQYGKWRIKCVKCASGRIVHDTDKASAIITLYKYFKLPFLSYAFTIELSNQKVPGYIS